MKKVYVVTSGSYSDYGIDAIFTTMELAQAFIDSFNKDKGYNDFNDIDEWDLDPHEIDLKAHRKAYDLRMNKEGQVTGLENSDSTYGHRNNSSISFTIDKVWMNVYCYADNEEHAVKIANEKRTQILALNRWGENE